MFSILVLVAILQAAFYVQALLLEDCGPLYTRDKYQCQDLARECLYTFGIRLKWTGAGTNDQENKPRGDGGCQCDQYCGYFSAKPCNHDKQCVWNKRMNACYSRKFKTPGRPILICPPPTTSPTKSPTPKPTYKPKYTHKPTTSPTTARPSETPTTTKPSYAPTTSPNAGVSGRPSQSPSKAPATSRPSEAPTTTKPSYVPTSSPLPAVSGRPSVSPSKAPVTSKPSKAPSKTPSKTPSRSPTTSKPSTSPSVAPSKSPTKCYKKVVGWAKVRPYKKYDYAKCWKDLPPNGGWLNTPFDPTKIATYDFDIVFNMQKGCMGGFNGGEGTLSVGENQNATLTWHADSSDITILDYPKAVFAQIPYIVDPSKFPITLDKNPYVLTVPKWTFSFYIYFEALVPCSWVKK